MNNETEVTKGLKSSPAIEIEQKVHFLVSTEVAAHAAGLVVAAIQARKKHPSPTAVATLMKLLLDDIGAVPIGEQINAIADRLNSALDG